MNLRDAAQQALEALEKHDAYCRNGIPQTWFDFVGKPAVAALRAALAEPEPRNQCGETCERAKLCAVCARGIADGNKDQDRDEIEALRASLREHMAEIHRLRAAGRQALGALQFGLPLIEDYGDEEQLAIHHKALAGLTEYAMQRLTDVQKEMEHQDSTGKTSYHIPDATKMVEPVAYVTGYFDGKCVIRPLEHVVFPTGMALYISPPTSQESRQVEPVAWRYIPSERLRDVVLTSDPSQARLAADYGCEVQPLYTAPPKREPLTDEGIEFRFGRKPTRYMMFLIRSTERAHGIGGEE